MKQTVKALPGWFGQELTQQPVLMAFSLNVWLKLKDSSLLFKVMSGTSKFMSWRVLAIKLFLNAWNFLVLFAILLLISVSTSPLRTSIYLSSIYFVSLSQLSSYVCHPFLFYSTRKLSYNFWPLVRSVLQNILDRLLLLMILELEFMLTEYW